MLSRSTLSLRSISRIDPTKLFIIGLLVFSGIMVIISQYSIFLIIHNNIETDNKISKSIKISYNKHNLNTELSKIVEPPLKINENKFIFTNAPIHDVVFITKPSQIKIIDNGKPSSDIKINPASNAMEDNLVWQIERDSQTCDNYFGNGYTTKTDVCSAHTQADSSINCKYSKFLASSICEFKNLLINKSNIRSSKGGESIEKVWGRSEDDEFCNYSPGTFAVNNCNLIPNWVQTLNLDHYPHHTLKIMKNLVVNIPDKIPSSCSQFFDTPTLLVTRYEYANLYHTMTDWFNVFVVIKMYNLRNPMIIFLDGHSAGSLDSFWNTVYGDKIKYIQHFDSNKLCFKNAYIVPPGYNSILSINYMNPFTSNCFNMKYVREFSNFVLNSFKFQTNLPTPTKSDKIKIKVIFRRDYKAHPRMGNRKASRKIANEEEVLNAARAVPNSIVESVSFEGMSMQDQIKVVREADMLIGFHGAGLSYTLFLQPHAILFELASNSYSARIHFEYFAKWSGIEYHRIVFSDASDENMMVDTALLKKTMIESLPNYMKRLEDSSSSTNLLKFVTSSPKLDISESGINLEINEAYIKLPIVDNFQLEKHTDLNANGSKPDFFLPSWDAIPPGKHRLAIIVPFRDSSSLTSQGGNRTANLATFLPHMKKHLSNAGVDFKIFVIEQTQGAIFNKGALFNIGYQLSKNGFDYMCLHDVDQVPLSERNTYTYPEVPTHLCSASSQFNFAMAYGSMVGGALLIQAAQYKEINGLSNKYFGWGQEDDDLYNRVMRSYPNFARLDATVGRYQALAHDRVKDLDVTTLFNRGRVYLGASVSSADHYKKDGAAQVVYSVKNYRSMKNHEHVVVELLFDFMPTSLYQEPPANFYKP